MRSGESGFVFTDDDWVDGTVDAIVEIGSREMGEDCVEVSDVLLKFFAELEAIRGAEKLEGGEGGRGLGGRRRGGVDEGTGFVDEEIDPVL